MYIRDKRSPLPKSEAVSSIMSRNRAKNTTPELSLRQLLWHSGLRGYRIHFKIKLPTKSSPPYARSEVAAILFFMWLTGWFSSSFVPIRVSSWLNILILKIVDFGLSGIIR